MELYRDPITGYEIRRYAEGPERNAKLYFTCENFSVNDKYFFFMKQQLEGRTDGGCYRANVETGEIDRVTDNAYRGFATDREKNVGYTCKNETEVYAVDLSTLKMTKHYCSIFDADIARDYDRFAPLAQISAPKEKIIKKSKR